MVNAEGGTRTPTGCPIRPSNVRVYQFHHFGTSGLIVNHRFNAKTQRKKAAPLFYFFGGSLLGAVAWFFLPALAFAEPLGVLALTGFLLAFVSTAAGWPVAPVVAGGVVAGAVCSVAGGVTGAGCVSAGPTLRPSDFLSNKPGTENRNAIEKNTIAAVMVTLASTVCVPRGPKAVELAPPPKTPEASDLLGWSKTNMISTKHAII